MDDCWCWWLCAVRAQMGSSLSQLRETQPPLFSGSKASRISASNRGDSDRKVIGWNVKWPPILRLWFRLCVICVHCSPWVLKHIQISKEIILVTNMCVFPLAKQLFTFCYHHTFDANLRFYIQTYTYFAFRLIFLTYIIPHVHHSALWGKQLEELGTRRSGVAW